MSSFGETNTNTQAEEHEVDAFLSTALEPDSDVIDPKPSSLPLSPQRGKENMHGSGSGSWNDGSTSSVGLTPEKFQTVLQILAPVARAMIETRLSERGQSDFSQAQIDAMTSSALRKVTVDHAQAFLKQAPIVLAALPERVKAIASPERTTTRKRASSPATRSHSPPPPVPSSSSRPSTSTSSVAPFESIDNSPMRSPPKAPKALQFGATPRSAYTLPPRGEREKLSISIPHTQSDSRSDSQTPPMSMFRKRKRPTPQEHSAGPSSAESGEFRFIPTKNDTTSSELAAPHRPYEDDQKMQESSTVAPLELEYGTDPPRRSGSRLSEGEILEQGLGRATVTGSVQKIGEQHGDAINPPPAVAATPPPPPPMPSVPLATSPTVCISHVGSILSRIDTLGFYVDRPSYEAIHRWNDRRISFDLSATNLVLQLVCVRHSDIVERLQGVDIAELSQRTASILLDTPISWPDLGSLVVRVNYGTDVSRYWFPGADPVTSEATAIQQSFDITAHIVEGVNRVDLVSLRDMSDRLFCLLATPPAEIDVQRAAKWRGEMEKYEAIRPVLLPSKPPRRDTGNPGSSSQSTAVPPAAGNFRSGLTNYNAILALV